MFLMFHVGLSKIYKWCEKYYMTDLKSNNITWHCKNCIFMFPFCSIDSTELAYIFTDLVDLNGLSNLDEIYTKCSVVNNIDFKQSSTNKTEFDMDINPDNHLYNNLNNICTYFTPEQTNFKLNSNSGLTIFKNNSKSLYKNFDEI